MGPSRAISHICRNKLVEEAHRGCCCWTKGKSRRLLHLEARPCLRRRHWTFLVLMVHQSLGKGNLKMLWSRNGDNLSRRWLVIPYLRCQLMVLGTVECSLI